MNITRITGVVVPFLAAIATGIGEVAKKPPFNETDFQKSLVLALIALIAVVTTADIIGRAVASSRSVAGTAGALSSGISATHTKPGADPDGQVVAMRSVDGLVQYLFVADSDKSISWLTESEIKLRPKPPT